MADAIKEHQDDIAAAVASVKPDLRLSVVKPLHAGWTVDTHTAMALRSDIISAGWEKTGLLFAVGGSPTEPKDKVSKTNKQQKSELQDEISTTKKRSPHGMSTSALTIVSWQEGLLHEHYFPSRLSQSSIDGRTSGSSACPATVQVAKHVLEGTMPFPSDGKLGQDWVDSFVAAIREGNKLYDAHPRFHGYLSCYQVVQLWPENISILKKDRFTSKPHCKDNMKRIFEESAADELTVGVLVKSPYSICVVARGGIVVVLDSHAHHLLHHGLCGALVSVSAASADSGDAAQYISEFFFLTAVCLVLSRRQTSRNCSCQTEVDVL